MWSQGSGKGKHTCDMSSTGDCGRTHCTVTRVLVCLTWGAGALHSPKSRRRVSDAPAQGHASTDLPCCSSLGLQQALHKPKEKRSCRGGARVFVCRTQIQAFLSPYSAVTVGESAAAFPSPPGLLRGWQSTDLFQKLTASRFP